MQQPYDYDVIIIGGGPGGYTAAELLGKGGQKVALIEQSALGGTCLNVGCIPTKALLHSAKAYYEAATSLAGQGIHVDAPRLHMPGMIAHKDGIVRTLREGVGLLMKSHKIDVISGTAHISGDNTVSVCDEDGQIRAYSCRRMIVATGAKPAMPPIPGAHLLGVMTSDGLLAYDQPIERIVIIGGGVIGCEFAGIYHFLGAKVTLIEGLERLLPLMDREISQNLSMILKKRGVDLYTSAKVERITQESGGLCCHFMDKNGSASVEADVVLMAAGRKPNWQGLFAEGMVVDANGSGGIAVNRFFQSSNPVIYAIGDVTGGIQLAHVAYAQAEHAACHILGKPPMADLSVVPSCVYTEPEIAVVGVTADEAKASGHKVKTGKALMSANGKSLIENQERGFIKTVYDEETGRLLGAQLMCGRASDLIGELALAVVNGLDKAALLKTIHPHPTFVEGVWESATAVK